MPVGLLRYSVGNENDPGDPWGRSELVVEPDGVARLQHYFSRAGGSGAWIGRVEASALSGLRAALERAGFPEVPALAPVAGAACRRLAVQAEGATRQVVIEARAAMSMPGYAEAFDLLDAVVRQLTGDQVEYPTKQPPIVRDIAAVAAPPA